MSLRIFNVLVCVKHGTSGEGTRHAAVSNSVLHLPEVGMPRADLREIATAKTVGYWYFGGGIVATNKGTKTS